MSNWNNRRVFVGLAIAATVLGLSATLSAGQDKPDEVTVTVKYTGKGTVDDNHRIWVWVFDTPKIAQGSIPIGEQSISTNGGSATFRTATKEVYIAIAYDEAGGFPGQAPPPSGSPIALYGAGDVSPTPVTPGPKGRVSVTFDDSQRMP